MALFSLIDPSQALHSLGRAKAWVQEEAGAAKTWVQQQIAPANQAGVANVGDANGGAEGAGGAPNSGPAKEAGAADTNSTYAAAGNDHVPVAVACNTTIPTLWRGPGVSQSMPTEVSEATPTEVSELSPPIEPGTSDIGTEPMSQPGGNGATDVSSSKPSAPEGNVPEGNDTIPESAPSDTLPGDPPSVTPRDTDVSSGPKDTIPESKPPPENELARGWRGVHNPEDWAEGEGLRGGDLRQKPFTVPKEYEGFFPPEVSGFAGVAYLLARSQVDFTVQNITGGARQDWDSLKKASQEAGKNPSPATAWSMVAAGGALLMSAAPALALGL